MNASTEINQLSAALVSAQKVLTNPHVDSKAEVPTKAGGKYSYEYLSLPSLIDHIRDVCQDVGLAILQDIGAEPGSVTVTTLILHESGQWMEFGPLLLPAAGGPQDHGSAITYGRRYALAAALGIASDADDDARVAQQRARDSWEDATPASRRQRAAKAEGRQRPAEPEGESSPASGSAGAPILASRHDITKQGPDAPGGSREPGSVTQPQMRKMAVLASGFGWNDAERHRQAEIESWTGLSKAEASWLIDQWEKFEKVLAAEAEEAAAAGTASAPGNGKPSDAGGGGLLAQAKAIYHGALLTKARLYDEHLRSERDIPDHILRELLESNV